MKKIALALLLVVVLAGCSSSVNQSGNKSVEHPTIENPTPTTAQQAQPEEQAATSTSGPDCYGPEIHPVGQAIADQFKDETTYNQVMVWFCNGIQFDDILTALQTEQLSDVTAADLLEMLSNGQTWDQIWVEIGLTTE